MIYVPIFGFLYATIRVLWAQHQFEAGLMSFADESVYFDQFQSSFMALACWFVPLYLWIRFKAGKERRGVR